MPINEHNLGMKAYVDDAIFNIAERFPDLSPEEQVWALDRGNPEVRCAVLDRKDKYALAARLIIARHTE